jgi:hypothetical protein
MLSIMPFNELEICLGMLADRAFPEGFRAFVDMAAIAASPAYLFIFGEKGVSFQLQE